jgi:hypothetical protein
MAVPRKRELHHYVPQFYLRQWCGTDGQLWACPLDGRAPFRTTPKAVAAEKGLYDSSGTPFEDFDYEGALARYESLFAERWPGVFDAIADPETKKNISRFLAIFNARHPTQKDLARRVNSLFRAMAERVKGHDEINVCLASGEQLRVKVGDIQRFASDTEANTRAGFLSAMRSSVQDVAKVLNARRWGVIIAEEPGFVTSDRPLVVSQGHCPDQSFGFGSPGTTITFPISPNRLLLIGDGFKTDGAHYRIDSVDKSNVDTIRGAGRFIFARERPWRETTTR